jgi:NAD(P)-dependent dehydrogenase (short-subunit alcohol dehydrogenase family)
MDMDIKGLRVLITAGASGIGLATARAFTREGARVHVCDVDASALQALAVSDPQITQSICDVSDRVQVAALFDAALKTLGGLDCLVNNAGITGQFNCARLAIPHLKASHNASMMNLSSQAGKHGFPLRSPYAAAKWGVIGFTKSIAIELGEFGVRVNALLPGLVAGDRIRRVIEAKAQQRGVTFKSQEEAMLAFTSLKDYVTPEQLADMIVFTASPRGRTISGQAISVCADTNMLG